MTATTETTTPRASALVFESYAELETAAGQDAWNAGDYHRAIKLWTLAARWSQEAAKAAAWDGAL